MKRWKKRLILGVCLGILLPNGLSSALAASDYPSRPIEVVISISPGGGMDIAARAFKDHVAKVLGQPIVFVYKPGGGSTIGTAFAAKAKPDGYTLVMSSTSSFVTTPLVKNVGYILEDFTPICNYSMLPLVWAAKDDGPYKTMQEFIQAAKTKKMKYASYGMLTQGHLCMELLSKVAGFEAIHIPYDGGATAMTAALGGHVDIAIAAGSTGMAGPGKLRVLATGAKERVDAFPNVPTLKELGYPVYGRTFYGIWAPKGTPKDVINKVYEAHLKVAKENGKEISEILKGLEQTMQILNPEEVWKVYREDYETQRKIVKEMGKLVE